jgi:hypothetical protein
VFPDQGGRFIIIEGPTPEIIQAIIAQATARGLSVDEYLRQMLAHRGTPEARAGDH